MYEPTRGGTRGGQAEFKWADVSADKDREHYLGHSINAPTGRWQKNKDVHWYNRDKKATDEEKALEIQQIKDAEREAMSVALGFKPSKPIGDGTTSGANAIPLPRTALSVAAVAAASEALQSNEEDEDNENEDQEGDQKLSKEEKRLRKIERRLAKAEHKRRKREEKEAQAMREVTARQEHSQQRHHHYRERDRPRRSRSVSPLRGDRSHARRYDRHYRDNSDQKRRSRSPPPHYNSRDGNQEDGGRKGTHGNYDEKEMEKERAKDRRRWEDNLARQERARGNWD